MVFKYMRIQLFVLASLFISPFANALVLNCSVSINNQATRSQIYWSKTATITTKGVVNFYSNPTEFLQAKYTPTATDADWEYAKRAQFHASTFTVIENNGAGPTVIKARIEAHFGKRSLVTSGPNEAFATYTDLYINSHRVAETYLNQIKCTVKSE